MRKPRDYAADLKALNDKARQLQERRVRELGELVIATGADTLPVEHLAGALLAATRTSDLVTKEEWRALGEAFFLRPSRKSSKIDTRNADGRASRSDGAEPAKGSASTT